jgi:hypothetical protein
MGLKDIAKSGMLGAGAALVADNPKLLQGMGLIGNIAANKLEDREERKRREAEMTAAGAAPAPGTPVMKKGGKVSSASKRADGCAIRGKTRA